MARTITSQKGPLGASTSKSIDPLSLKNSGSHLAFSWTIFLTLVLRVLPEVLALLSLADNGNVVSLDFSRSGPNGDKITMKKTVDGKVLTTRTVKGTVS